MKNLKEVLFGDRREEVYKLGDHSIVLCTLTSGEKKEVNRRTFAEFPGANVFLHEDAAKILKLAKSLISVDGTPVHNYPEIAKLLRENKGMEVHEAVEKVLSDFDNDVINALMSYYADLEDKRNKEVELLKNSSAALSAGLSGNSQNVSESNA